MALETPRSEVIQRVFAISVDGKSCGSALAYPLKGGFCFITAAHVLKGMSEGKEGIINIFKDGQWLKSTATPFFCDKDIDIAILKTPVPSTEETVKPLLSGKGAIVGQDAYFLGFPYFGQSIEYKPQEINQGFPLPFVKKGIISAINFPLIYVDGHNNPGFSGGPVVFWDHHSQKQKVIGVISSYLNHFGQVRRTENEIDLFYAENSGIGIAYHIKCAIDLINKIYGTEIPFDF